MIEIKLILCPVDFSEFSIRAIGMLCRWPSTIEPS